MTQMRARGRWLRLLWTMLASGAALLLGRGEASDQPQSAPRALVLNIDGAIGTGVAEYVESGLTEARTGSYDLVVITLDTPGGNLEATRDIVKRMMGSEIPIVVWVGPAGARAGSAGVFITMAGQVAAMHPASNIGAAHPVTGGGGDVEKEAGKDMAKKVENDTAAFARSIALERGRNADWAEKAVRESVSVTADDALKIRVIDLTAPDLPTLLAAADGRQVKTPSGTKALRSKGAVLMPLEMTVRQRTLGFLSDPNIVALLTLIGMLGIALEFYHPGSIIPGAVGAFCLLVAFLAMRVIPVNVGAVLLILAGVALLIAEAYITTHGLAGAAGAVCVVLGMLLFIDKSSPDYRFSPGAFHLSPLVIWPTPIALAGLLTFVAWKVIGSRRGPLVTGAQGLLGEVGEALTAVGPEGGKVFLHGEYWKARAETSIPQGSRVRVTAVAGLTVTVVAVESVPQT